MKTKASFLSDRSFHVSVNKTDSATHPILYGVPQGAISSPFLYNFFTADSPQINESETATFADDTAIFVSNGDPGVVCNRRLTFTGHTARFIKKLEKAFGFIIYSFFNRKSKLNVHDKLLL
jgi:hypothetical protein